MTAMIRIGPATVWWRLRTRLHQNGNDEGGSGDGEAGNTLMEVMASMVLLSIFMAIFTASMLQLFQVSQRVNATIDSSAQVNLAFMKLDKQVRYASQIDTPVLVGSDWYVEFATAVTDTCTQVRLDGTDLQQRSWPTSATSYPSFTTMATNVAISAGFSQPFTLLPTGDGTHLKQRVVFDVAATAGPTAQTSTTSQLGVTFTAFNSSTASPVSTVCAGGMHS